MGVESSRAVESPPSTLRTFLLADIRGYTRYSAEHGDAAAAQLSERFLAVCREVIEAHEGEVFGSAGDQALAAFSSAHAALRGALDLQRRLAQEQEAHPDRPMMAGVGLDTGEAMRVGNDYRGNAINLAARLCSIAGPGEIFAAETVIAVAHLVEGVALVDRGEVRLKGLEHPVRVIQVAGEGEIEPDLPPLQPLLVTHPNNLPDEPTPFIGREREVRAVRELLATSGVRLVTLTGAGGTGKTRLALQVGNALLHDFPDGVFFVNLAPLSDPALVPSALAEVLDVKEVAGKELLATLVDALRDKHLLLVLDNFEHLLPASAAISSLLEGCRQLRVLVTSRIPLHLSREHEYLVPPLSVPDPKRLPDLATLSQYEAVALFIERARAVKSGFSVTNENAPAVAEICSRLDGLPLAIELAAARIKLFPPQALLSRLGKRLDLLTGGARDKPTRQQTLRGTLDWSYSLLSLEEQTLFSRLSAFAGGWSFEAAEAVCNLDGRLDVLEGLGSLVDKSLVRQEGEEEPRFSMLETIREYAAEKLAAGNDEELIKQAHASYFLRLVEEAEGASRTPDQATWHAALERESDNLRGALQWLTQRGSDEGLRLAAALGWFWTSHGHWREGRRWLEEALERAPAADAALRAKALDRLGDLLYRLGDPDAATARLEASLQLAEESGDVTARANTLNSLGNIASYTWQLDRASSYYEESLALWRQLGDERRTGMLLGNLGTIARDREDLPAARQWFEQGLAISQRLGNLEHVSWSYFELGSLALEQGRLEEAETLLAKSLRLAQDLGSTFMIGWAAVHLARAPLRRGQLDEAQRRYDEALILGQECETQWHVGEAQLGLGQIALQRGIPEEAQAHFERCLALAQEMQLADFIPLATLALAAVARQRRQLDVAREKLHAGLRLLGEPPLRSSFGQIGLHEAAYVMAELGQHEEAARLKGRELTQRENIQPYVITSRPGEEESLLAGLRTALGKEPFDRAWQEGVAMSQEEAIARALSASPERERAASRETG